MGLHPEYPIVNNTYQMTEEWSITLNKPYNRRIEDGSLVLWCHGFTLWINVWGNDNNKSIIERALLLKKDISKSAIEIEEEKSNNIIKIGYVINENNHEEAVISYNGFVINENSYVQISIYFDAVTDVSIARNIFQSIKNLNP